MKCSYIKVKVFIFNYIDLTDMGLAVNSILGFHLQNKLRTCYSKHFNFIACCEALDLSYSILELDSYNHPSNHS